MGTRCCHLSGAFAYLAPCTLDAPPWPGPELQPHDTRVPSPSSQLCQELGRSKAVEHQPLTWLPAAPPAPTPDAGREPRVKVT